MIACQAGMKIAVWVPGLRYLGESQWVSAASIWKKDAPVSGDLLSLAAACLFARPGHEVFRDPVLRQPGHRVPSSVLSFRFASCGLKLSRGKDRNISTRVDCLSRQIG